MIAEWKQILDGDDGVEVSEPDGHVDGTLCIELDVRVDGAYAFDGDVRRALRDCYGDDWRRSSEWSPTAMTLVSRWVRVQP